MKKIGMVAISLLLCVGSWASIHIENLGGIKGDLSMTALNVTDGEVFVLMKGRQGDLLNGTTVESNVGIWSGVMSSGTGSPSGGVQYFTVTNGVASLTITNGAASFTSTSLVRMHSDAGNLQYLGDTGVSQASGVFALNYSSGTSADVAVFLGIGSGAAHGYLPGELAADDPMTLAFTTLFKRSGYYGVGTNGSFINTLNDVSTEVTGVHAVGFAEATGENRASDFDSDPVVASGISTNASYSATLTDYATDLDGDPMTFWKQTGGPAWLNVASNGALTGTSPGTAGLNSWTVFVTDNNGETNSATLEINVATSDFYDVLLTSTNLYVQGAKFMNSDGNGINFHRFGSEIYATKVNVDPVNAKTTSGAKLTFYTRSDTIKLTFDYVIGDEFRNSSKFTTYQNGAYVSTPSVSVAVNEKNEVAEKTTLVMELTSDSALGELVRHDVVLPNYANPILSRVQLKNGEDLEEGNPFPSKQIVFLGDSISHGTGQGTTAEGYPYQVAEELDMELFNLAVGGGKIAPEVAALLQYFDPVEAIWVLIGFNDWQGANKNAADIASEYETLLATIRLHQPDAELFCSTLVATSLTNDFESGVTTEEVRQAVSAVVNARIVAGDTKLHLVDGTSYSTVADVGNTIVHFSTEGAARVATNVVAIMDPVINPPKPNILFIAIDDINPVLGCYGDPLAISPNIDTLAQAGVTFLNAHCQWAVCGPSRASLMTGLMPEETGVMGFRKMRGDAVDLSKENTNVKRPNVVTIPQYFRYNGYRTTATGKINDNRCVGSLDTSSFKVAEDGRTVEDPPSWGDPVDPNNLPADFFSTSSYVRADGGWGPAGKPVTGATNLADSAFADGMVCDEGIALLRDLATTDSPFFLGVGFKKPHIPFVAPQKYWDWYDRDDFEIHPFQEHPKNAVSYTWNYAKELAGYDEFAIDGNSVTNIPESIQKRMLHGYYACVSFVDVQVGRLLAELEAQGLHTNTIVVLWGDHGYHLGDHAEWAKHTNLEQASRVPFIIYNPFSEQSGIQSGTPVTLMDLYPTLCELAGLPIPEQPLDENEDPFTAATGRSLKGKSLMGIVNGTADSVRTGAVNMFARDGAKGYAYRTDRYRYTEWVKGGVVDARELYDYDLDPMETVNLAGEPGYDALMYQFSKAMRKEFDDMKLGANDFAAIELQDSPVYDTMAGNLSLRGIELSGNSIAWADAAGVTYNLMSKTNLLDASWSTNQAGLVGSPVVILQPEGQEFFRVEVGN